MISVHDLVGFAPALVLLGGIVLVLSFDLAWRRAPSSVLGVALLVAAAGGGAYGLDRPSASLFSGLLVDDVLSRVGFVLFAAVSTAALLLGGRGAEPREPGRHEGEWVMVVLLGTVAMAVLSSAVDLLSMFLGLETLSVMSYLLVALGRRRRAAAEAALKYVLYGGVSSGVMLYGMSLLYGLSGSGRLADIGAHIGAAPVLGTLGVVLCVVGFGYKVAAVPFHAWAPDVYDGAPAPVAAWLSVGPKLAGLVALYRFVTVAAPSALPDGMATPWSHLWPLLAFATMTFGNLAALAQERVQRMLAYSGVAQVGYLLAALSAGPVGATAMLVYAAAYAAMNLGAFAVICCADRMGIAGGMLDWRGFARRAPWLGVPMACFLFSLVGLPPFAGFFGKWGILSALLGDPTPLSGGLALAVVLNSVLSLAYYGRFVRVMFLEEQPATVGIVPAGRGAMATVLLCGAATLGFAWCLEWVTARGQEAVAAAQRPAESRPTAASLQLPVLR